MKNNNGKFLKAVEITPKDDTYHGNLNLLDIEWWYFDAVFTNGYSIHIGFRIYHIRKIGLLQTRITLYKDGKTQKEHLKINLFSDFKTGEIYPDISIKKNCVVEFDKDHYKKNGQFRYMVNLSIKETQINLVFTAKTKGWKIETPNTCWAVPLPKADVKGTIQTDGETISVQGVGYHDHNWSYSPKTAMNNLGWYWGRICGEQTNITWAKTIENKQKSDLITVLNIDKNQDEKQLFFSINPENILLLQDKFELKKRRLIPTEFNLQAKGETIDKKPIVIDIKMHTLDIQYQRIFTIQYYRYHVMTNGIIKIGDKVEELKDKPQIIEFLSFKSKKFK
jgi:predicted secreted hydrolase